MSYECSSCSATFETLTRKRLHQRDDCPGTDAVVDVADLEAEAMASTVVEELLVCDVCGADNTGANAIDSDVTDAGFTVTLRFDCERCGAHNTNEGVLA